VGWSEKFFEDFTYYYAREACFKNRTFLVEMMHTGSIYEDQIETF
jgi:hypothetical protein